MVNITKKPFSIAVGIFIILTAMLVFMAGCKKVEDNTKIGSNISEEPTQQTQEDTVLYLGKDAVSVEEYQMLAAEYCNQVYMRYTTEQVNSPDFWETEIDGVLPYTLLEEMILDELKKNYAIKSLAIEQGVIENYTYADMMASMQAENESRAESSNGEVSYGINNFEASSYYKYWYSNLETQLINSLILEKIDVSQEDCRNYYDQNDEDFAYEVGVSILYAEVPYASVSEKNEAAQIANRLYQAMQNTDSAEELADAFSIVSIEKIELNSLNTQAGMSGVYTHRWELASQLDVGEVCGPYEEDWAFCVIKCIERTENGKLKYKDVKAQIESYLQAQEAQQMISRKMKKLKVKEGTYSTKKAILEATGK